MKELERQLYDLLLESDIDLLNIESIQKEESITPFNTVNRIMAYLLSTGKITYSDYENLSNEFIKRHQQQNQYLYLFDMSPRTFGQTWGETYINTMFPQLKKATKESLAHVYPNFDGEFDLWLDGIRIEVKACRANSTNSKGSLSRRAYSHAEAQKANFKYHYQQSKNLFLKRRRTKTISR